MATPLIPKKKEWNLVPYYKTKQVIGSGSYGSVSEAQLLEAKFGRKQGELVAIKQVKHLFDDLIDCKRILREISILRALDHANIVKLIDVFTPPGVAKGDFQELYMVMEICDSDLKKLCKQDVHLGEPHIQTLLYGLLAGVKYLHSAGIYHRDLKPANCLVNQDCTVKICDFGLSRAIGVEQPHLPGLQNSPRGEGGQEAGGVVVAPTQRLKRHLTGHVVTRWYRAPELILLDEDYTEQIDVWSVGCIFGELLGMLEGKSLQDRSPLFPGSSCFPLSPDAKHKTDYKYHTRGKHDQLNMIFNLIGTPSEDDHKFLKREDAKKYLNCFAAREGDGMESKFPHAKQYKGALALLQKMLVFNPGKRIRVDAALQDPWLKDVRKPETETTRTEGQVKCEFEKKKELEENDLRNEFWTAVAEYHPGGVPTQ